jgi:hypothetical protein
MVGHHLTVDVEDVRLIVCLRVPVRGTQQMADKQRAKWRTAR